MAPTRTPEPKTPKKSVEDGGISKSSSTKKYKTTKRDARVERDLRQIDIANPPSAEDIARRSKLEAALAAQRKLVEEAKNIWEKEKAVEHNLVMALGETKNHEGDLFTLYQLTIVDTIHRKMWSPSEGELVDICGIPGSDSEKEILLELGKRIVDVVWFCKHDVRERHITHFMRKDFIDLVVPEDEMTDFFKTMLARKRHNQNQTIKEKFLKVAINNIIKRDDGLGVGLWTQLPEDEAARRKEIEQVLLEFDDFYAVFPTVASTVDIPNILVTDDAPRAKAWLYHVLTELLNAYWLKTQGDLVVDEVEVGKMLVKLWPTIHVEAEKKGIDGRIESTPIYEHFGQYSTHPNRRINNRNVTHAPHELRNTDHRLTHKLDEGGPGGAGAFPSNEVMSRCASIADEARKEQMARE